MQHYIHSRMDIFYSGWIKAKKRKNQYFNLVIMNYKGNSYSYIYKYAMNNMRFYLSTQKYCCSSHLTCPKFIKSCFSASWFATSMLLFSIWTAHEFVKWILSDSSVQLTNNICIKVPIKWHKKVNFIVHVYLQIIKIC